MHYHCGQIGPEAVYTAIKSVIIAGEYAKQAGWTEVF
jgi:stage V sporulation protein SpoVS